MSEDARPPTITIESLPRTNEQRMVSALEELVGIARELRVHMNGANGKATHKRKGTPKNPRIALRDAEHSADETTKFLFTGMLPSTFVVAAVRQTPLTNHRLPRCLVKSSPGGGVTAF
jgi:hypothetical protein